MAANARRKKSGVRSESGQLPLSSFFKANVPSQRIVSSPFVPENSRKRIREKDSPLDEMMSQSPPKRMSPDGLSSLSDSLSPTSQDTRENLNGHEVEPSPMSESPCSKLSSENFSSSPEPLTPLSQEQQDRMEKKKMEAEAKQLAKRFGAKEMGASWVQALLAEFKKPYIQELIEFVKEERLKRVVYPAANDVLSWTLTCSIEEVKVVILGQDPYHGPGQAHGMCFSVRVGVAPPPSLLNIFKELENDVQTFCRPNHGYLMGWAKQGVLLLNACLTVRQKEPKSHADKGWEKLTDAVVHWLNSKMRGLVFLLWGKDAQKKCSFIDGKKHRVLKSVHPSPLSAHRGFLGCRHFSQANQYLKSVGKKPIEWNYLPEK